MSRERYLKALQCEEPDVIPHQISLYHPEFISQATGVDYYEKPMTASLRFHECFDIDNGGPVHVEDTPLPRPILGNTENGGIRTKGGFDTVWHKESPFTKPEELWNFDPDPWGQDAYHAIEPDYALKNFRWCFKRDLWPERRRQEAEAWAKVEALFPGRFTNGAAFYCTAFMWGICIFGWDIFLRALGLDPDKTGAALQRLSEVTVKMYEYFATCEGVLFVAPHDDLCISNGPVISPAWYCKYIYPLYERIFTPIKALGKPIIFISDGDISKLAADIAPLVDGFIFDSSTSADFMFQNFGKDKCLIGGIDVRLLTFGTPDDVEKEVQKVVERGRDCPGYVIACSGTIGSNAPLANLYRYFETVEMVRRR